MEPAHVNPNAVGLVETDVRRKLCVVPGCDWKQVQADAELVIFNFADCDAVPFDSILIVVAAVDENGAATHDGVVTIYTSEDRAAPEDPASGLLDPINVAAGKQVTREIGPKQLRTSYKVTVKRSDAPAGATSKYKARIVGLLR